MTDFGGDGKADLAVYRPGSPSRWFAVSPVAGAIFPMEPAPGGLPYGLAGDIPVQAPPAVRARSWPRE